VIGVVERLRLAPDLQDGVLFVGPRAVAIDPDADGYSTVLNAYSRNGFEQIPFVAAPRVATSSKAMASFGARPNAMAICPRGIASVWIRAPVAGSHSQ